MLPDLKADLHEWPIPFADGIDKLLARRGQSSVMLVSGDPFWFGAGSSITRHLDRQEWLSIAGYSCFSLAASQIGWPIEATTCLGLHAAPLSRLRPYLAPKQKIMATMRDGRAVHDLISYLKETGFGDSEVICLEALGQEDQKITIAQANKPIDFNPTHPVMVALSIAGEGKIMPKSAGLADEWFEHDGQITKQPIRALTLAALAPKSGEYLWDLGAGSGSIAIEWLLSDASMRATAVERDAKRAEAITRNAQNLGVDYLDVVEAEVSAAIETLPMADCIFIGGGLREAVLHRLWALMPQGTRLVANGVTVETERLLTAAYSEFGGTLLRFEASNLAPIGTMHGWKAAYPITQWSVTK